MNRKSIILTILFVSTAILVFANFKKISIDSKFESQLNGLKRIAKANTDALPLIDGSTERAQLFEIRSIYDRFDPKSPITSKMLNDLRTMGAGLVSPNEIVRETTGDLVRHILSSWVRHHENPKIYPEIDVFFRFYAKENCQSLKEFLTRFPDSPEAQYLKQI